MKKLAFLFSLLVVSILPLFGQYHSTVTYSTRDGMPTSELLCVFVDSKGYIWAGSNLGVSRFDGNTFRNFSTEDGLAGNSIYNVIEDDEGAIWIIHNSNSDEETIATVLKDGVMYYVDVKEMTGLVTKKLSLNPHSRKVQVTSIGELWTFDRVKKRFFLEAKFEPEWEDSGNIHFQTDPFTDRHLIIEVHEDRKIVRSTIWQGGKFIPLPPLRLDRPAQNILIRGVPDEKVLVIADGALYRFEFGKGWSPLLSNLQLTAPEVNLFPFDAQHQLLFEKNGQLEFRLMEFNRRYPDGISLYFRNPNFIQNIQRAPDGTYWAASRNGLIHIFPAFTDFTIDDNQQLSDLHAICEDREGKIWFGSYRYGFSHFDGKEMHPGPDSFFVLPGSMLDEDENMLFWIEKTRTNPYFKGVFSFDGQTSPRRVLADSIGFYFHRAYDGEVGYGFLKLGLGIRKPNSSCPSCIEVIGEEKGLGLANVLTTVKDRQGRWWMGRPSTGIACYDPRQDTVITWLRENPRHQIGAMSSLLDYKGNLWFGTTQGLRFFAPSDSLNLSLLDPTRDFLPVGLPETGNSSVHFLTQYDTHTLLIGNQEGVALLDLKSFYDGDTLRLYMIRSEDGYSGSGTEQNCVWIDQNRRVWIGSDAGAHCFNPRLFSRGETTPGFSIDSLVYGKYVSAPSPIPTQPDRLPRAERGQDLLVHLSSEKDPIRPNHLYYVYRLSVDSAFSKPQHEGIVEFQNLAPGDYSLEVKVMKDGWESEVKTIYFKLPRPFWETPVPWMAITSFVALLYWFFQRNLNHQKMEKNKLQVQAIVNQLNPHFINNALQWVQIRVYQDEDAVGVISKLGENIRLVFKNSREKKAFHPLKEEMRLVENYLYIQKKRFGDHLSYELPDAKSLEKLAHVNLPLMQIQIHCENAVEHGIRNKEEPGRVRILIAEEKEHLHITVEDDGIGRRKAEEIGSKGTQQGTQMLENLKDIFNKKNPQPIRYAIEDDIFTDTRGEKHGTRIQIWIPKDYRYELD